MTTQAPYPWFKEQMLACQKKLTQQSLPHAQLLQGPAGIGKEALALCFAKEILLDSVRDEPVRQQQCRQLLKADSHPDLWLLTPEEEGKIIGIESVRTLVTKICQTPQQAAAKVIVITPADALGINAANALLKTLEQPVANTYFILVTASPAQLLATIRSRCQVLRLPAPDSACAMAWLQQQFPAKKQQTLAQAMLIAVGAPLLAQDFLINKGMENLQDIIDGLYQMKQHNWCEICKKWQALPLTMVVNTLMNATFSLLRGSMLGSNYIEGRAPLVAPPALLDFWDVLQQCRQVILSKYTVNQQLLLEDLCIRWLSYQGSDTYERQQRK